MISVLLCTYNRENLIRESIDSILAQTYKDFELIIVDDGSTDGTRKILESYKDERIRLIFQEKNKFYCRSANDGIKQMRGDYLAFATSDDTWHPDKLQKQMDYLKEHPECGACFTFANIIDDHGEPAEEKFPNIAQLLHQNFETRAEWMRFFFRDGNCVAHPSAVLPRWMVEKLKGFHLLFCQGADLEMWIRAVQLAPIYVISENLICYRCHQDPENQISGDSRLKAARFTNEQMLMRKKMMKALSDEELIRYFGMLFKKKDAHTHLELEIERAFLLSECVHDLPDLNVLGIEKFEEILDQYQEEAVEVLEKEYHTALKDLYRLNLKHFYVDYGICSEKAELLTVQHELGLKLQETIVNCTEEKKQIALEWNATQNEKAKLMHENEQLLEVLKQKKADNEILTKQVEKAKAEIGKLEEKIFLHEQENVRMRRTLELQVLENIKLNENNSGKRKQL